MNWAITNFKLKAANVGKLKLLDKVATVYIRAIQKLVNFLIATEQQVPDKYEEIPGDEANLIGPPSPENQLSERWRRCGAELVCWLRNQRWWGGTERFSDQQRHGCNSWHKTCQQTNEPKQSVENSLCHNQSKPHFFDGVLALKKREHRSKKDPRNLGNH